MVHLHHTYSRSRPRSIWLIPAIPSTKSSNRRPTHTKKRCNPPRLIEKRKDPPRGLLTKRLILSISNFIPLPAHIILIQTPILFTTSRRIGLQTLQHLLILPPALPKRNFTKYVLSRGCKPRFLQICVLKLKNNPCGKYHRHYWKCVWK